MEFSSEMNIYRESELSGDFEGEIRERRNQQENNQGALVDPQPISPTGNSTYYPGTGTSLIEMSKISGNISEKDYIFTEFLENFPIFPTSPGHAQT